MSDRTKSKDDRYRQLTIQTMPNIGYVIYEGMTAVAAFHHMRGALGWLEGSLMYADMPPPPDLYEGLEGFNK